jgi:hypothetical protein
MRETKKKSNQNWCLEPSHRRQKGLGFRGLGCVYNAGIKPKIDDE